MRRLLALLAILALLFFIAAPAANAAPEQNCRAVPLQLEDVPLGINIPVPQVCVTMDGSTTTVTDLAGNVLMTLVTPVQTIVERVEVPVIVPGPAPAPVTVTAPPPPAATETVTRTATETARETVTVTEEGQTITETVPAPSAAPTTTNGPVGQDRDRSDRVDADSTPRLTVPPSANTEPGPVFDFVPDDPEVAAATFSIVGFLAGIALGIIGLIVAYKRGKTDGEQATMDEFLGTLHPTGPKHRA